MSFRLSTVVSPGGRGLGCKTSSCLDESGVWWTPTVGVGELAIGFGEFSRREHGAGTLPDEIGPTCVELLGERIEPSDQVVVELHEHFASSHEHMVSPMVGVSNGLSPVALPIVLQGYDEVPRRGHAIKSSARSLGEAKVGSFRPVSGFGWSN
jgi:hypothetical protein